MTSLTLITGGTGLVGSHLVQRLNEQGSEIKVFKGDIRNEDVVRKAVEGIDFIYHCAGFISYQRKDAENLYKINVLGTRNLLNASLELGVKRVVHVSSVSALNSEEDYGLSKKFSELECSNAVEKCLDIVVARPVTVYGAGDKNRNSFYPFRMIAKSRIVFVPPGGKSYVHVDDLVDGLVLCMEKGKNGETYTFSSEHLLFSELFSMISESARPRAILLKIPKFMRFFAHYSRDFNKETIERFFETEFFDADTLELGWKPTRTIREAVKSMCHYYGIADARRL